MSNSSPPDAQNVVSRLSLGEAILETATDAIVASDGDGTIWFWNPGAERIFGYSRAEAVGRSLDIIIPEKLRERHWAGYRQVMASGQSRYGHADILAVPGIRKDGTRISLEFTIVPLRDDTGRMVGVVALMRDVSARFEEMQALRRQASQRPARP